MTLAFEPIASEFQRGWKARAGSRVYWIEPRKIVKGKASFDVYVQDRSNKAFRNHWYHLTPHEKPASSLLKAKALVRKDFSRSRSTAHGSTR